MNQQPSQEQVAAWYDEYTKRQKNTGVNLRHREIMHQLKKYGLKPNHNVLEVGCGIGTLTSLLAHYVTKSITAADISPESVAVGKQLLKQHNHIDWVVTDMSDFANGKTYDFIVLPDVMEHIPQELHANLFKTLFAHSHDETVVFIHIPHPRFTDWNKIHRPEGQQVIDQALDSSLLLRDAYAAGYYLRDLVSYSLWEEPFDYQRIVFLVNGPYKRIRKINKFKMVLTTWRRKYFG